MNQHQIFALDQYLSSYPLNATFAEVLNMLNDGSQEVTVLDQWSDFWHDQIVEFIQELATALAATYGQYISACQASLDLIRNPDADLYFDGEALESQLSAVMGHRHA